MILPNIIRWLKQLPDSKVIRAVHCLALGHGLVNLSEYLQVSQYRLRDPPEPEPEPRDNSIFGILRAVLTLY